MPKTGRQSGRTVEIDAKVAFLSAPAAYPERTRRVDVLETHMSWVFLTDAHAYKLKKPVRYGFLDYTTVKARKLNCDRELELNRRLAPDVYRAVVPLLCDDEGRLYLGRGGSRAGTVVDWLVKMRRLRAEDTLEHAILAHAVRRQDIERVVRQLGAFYRACAPEALLPEDYCASFRAQVAADRDALLQPAYRLDRAAVEAIAAAQLAFLDRHGGMLAERARSRRIVEGHGDLRPEHVYLGDSPVIVDCLEFHRAFRVVDPASELAYLAMECDRLGAPEIDGWLFAAYRAETADDPPRCLIEFYKGRHAGLRAKIAIQHLDDGAVREPEKWRARTGRYLDLAADYGRRLAAGG
jgi:aminoglycoside phosphotransferase family enzyme